MKSGDSLWAIANANGVSVANLRQWNSLSGDIIYPGQKLVVKKGGSTNSSAGSSSSQSSSQSGKTHVVKSGNTLWGLAQQYGTSVQKLKQLNNLASDIIYIGQTLKVK
ncbi:LysM peptidoglycan-binding domain-containing protein [Enterococcus sp. UD-01]|uniref:LysM peptidoglycan-binding domain-containing protein n=1 Tax=Enterococcus sp. UD-01 TaxID=3373911 RepID=UPI00384CCF05